MSTLLARKYKIIIIIIIIINCFNFNMLQKFLKMSKWDYIK